MQVGEAEPADALPPARGGTRPGRRLLWLGLGVAAVALGVYADVGTIVRQYRAPVWLAAGLVVGGGYGLLGAATRTRRRVLRELAWCGLVAVPVVDVVLPVRLDGAAASPVLVVLAAVVAALLWWAFRDWTLRRTHLVLGATTVAFALWQCEVLVLRVVFGRNV